jgi:aspartyl protease family protein
MYRHFVVLGAAIAVSLGVAHEMQGLKPRPGVAQAAPIATPMAEAVAAAPTPAEGSAAQVSKAADGHYWAEAEVNGRWIHCLIDTGASVVALTPADAERLGVDVHNLTYDAPVNTANGLTKAARVKLDYVSVAGARVGDVPAMVVKDGLSTSLLGMSYLGRLSRMEATPSALILRP